LIAGTLAFLVMDLATGQFSPGTGFDRMSAYPDPLTLLRNKSVKQELRVTLTDEQWARIHDALWAALAKEMDEDQLKRLKEIDLQQRGYQAFADPTVQKALKMEDPQREEVKKILAEGDKEIQELIKDYKGGVDLQGVKDKINASRKDTRDRVMSVLSNEQKRIYQEMLGDEFKIDFGKGVIPDPKESGKGKGKGKGKGG
jgi:hypothetical protein